MMGSRAEVRDGVNSTACDVASVFSVCNLLFTMTAMGRRRDREEEETFACGI